MVLVYLPLVAVVFVLAGLALAGYSRRVDRALKRLGYVTFGGFGVEVDRRRERVLRAAGIGTPYRLYATQTQLYAAAAAFCGSIIGIYAAAYAIDVFDVELKAPPAYDELFLAVPEALRSFNVKLFVVLGLASIVFGVLCAFGAYVVRWQLPSIRAGTRKRQIDAGLPRMVAFVYALSRGGMAFTDVMRTLSKNRGVFGAGAAEVGVAVRNIDLFGQDVVNAVDDLSRRTPSDQFQTFSENLVSVLRSGGNLSEFLREEYNRYREQAEDQQQEILDLLATTAEVYVTVIVAGMLFLITILFVIGLTAGDTLVLIRVLAYIVLPAANVMFIAYLSEITRPLRATRQQGRDADRDGEGMTRPATVPEGGRATGTDGGTPSTAGGGSPSGADGGSPSGADGGSPSGADGGSTPTADGGTPATVGAAATARTKANWDRLRAHRRLSRVREALRRPVESLIDEPTLLFYLTVPIAVLFLLVQFPTGFQAGGYELRVLDDAIVQAVLFVLATFAVVYEISKRRLKRLEAALPDLLERLASLNEAGVAVVSSFDRIRRSDVGALDEEVERIWRDVRWGSTVEEALTRFERRVQTPEVTRIVTLLTNSMRASNEIGPVLRIAAEQARSDRRLKRQRKQVMFTYLIVIYIAFIVFLVVIGAIDTVLIPNLPNPGETTQALQQAEFLRFGTVNVEAYRLVFFHTALIQAALSGLVGGQMGGGSLKDGAKHATIMLAVTYAFFLWASTPISV